MFQLLLGSKYGPIQTILSFLSIRKVWMLSSLCSVFNECKYDVLIHRKFKFCEVYILNLIFRREREKRTGKRGFIFRILSAFVRENHLKFFKIFKYESYMKFSEVVEKGLKKREKQLSFLKTGENVTYAEKLGKISCETISENSPINYRVLFAPSYFTVKDLVYLDYFCEASLTSKVVKNNKNYEEVGELFSFNNIRRKLNVSTELDNVNKNLIIKEKPRKVFEDFKLRIYGFLYKENKDESRAFSLYKKMMEYELYNFYFKDDLFFYSMLNNYYKYDLDKIITSAKIVNISTNEVLDQLFRGYKDYNLKEKLCKNCFVDIKYMKFLCEKYFDINDYKHFFIKSCVGGELESVKYFLNEIDIIDVNYQYYNKKTVFHRICNGGNYIGYDIEKLKKVIVVLIENNLNIEIKDSKKNVGVKYLIDNNNFEILYFLIEKGILSHSNENSCKVIKKHMKAVFENGYSFLHQMCFEGYYEIVKFLVELGADLNKISKEKEKPIHLARKRRHWKLVGLLASHKHQNISRTFKKKYYSKYKRYLIPVNSFKK